jgi:hypothetical protein
MPSLFQRNSPSRPIVVIAMILGLLLAQGLRVCVHGVTEVGVFSAEAGVTHLESNLMTDDSDGATSPDWHASFSIVLQQLGIKFELLAITVALLILPLLQVVRRVPAPPATAAPLASFHALRPPLRAPPL